MTGEEHIRLVVSNGLATITLNRPPLNVLDIAMMVELNNALGQALANDRTGVVLIRAEGKAFCAGVDVADHKPDRVGDMLGAFGRLSETLLGTDVPTVAAVQGAALGGGMELVICCDLVLASDRAKFGQPEIQLGVFPPIAAALLPRICGLTRAMDLVLTGRTMSAAEARELGLVTQVCPADGFDARVTEYVTQLTGLSRPVLRMSKRVTLQELRAGGQRRIAEAERIYLDELMKLSDAHEGIGAFLEKREPQWKHA